MFLLFLQPTESSVSTDSAYLLKMFSRFKNAIDMDALNSTINKFHKRSGSRSFEFLTPGQEFLLSVASYEDAKGSSWESVPYLLNILQAGKLDSKNTEISQKNDKNTEIVFPMRMMQMMKVMTAMEKADKNNEIEDKETTSFSSFLQKLSRDPQNILLAAIIPFSILLAAVIPLLKNQLSSGSLLNTINTSAGNGKSYQQRQFLENLVPILEGITKFGSQFSNDVTKESGDKKKVNVLKNILNYISNFISEKWIKNFPSTPVQRIRSSCSGNNCSTKR